MLPSEFLVPVIVIFFPTVKSEGEPVIVLLIVVDPEMNTMAEPWLAVVVPIS